MDPKSPVQPLSHLSARLAEHLGQPAPPYRHLWLAIADGRLPGLLDLTAGRWWFHEKDVLEIAAVLGLKPAPLLTQP